MFETIFNNNLNILRDSCCSCGCGCKCKPESTESSVRSGGSSSGAASSSKYSPSTSA